MPAKTRKPPWKKKNPRKKAGRSSRKLGCAAPHVPRIVVSPS